MQTRVGFGDPGQLVPLPVGEVVGVLPQRVAGVLVAAGITGGQAHAISVALGLPGAAGVVPCLASYFVEGFGGPHLTMWNASAHCTVAGQRSVTISAIQSA